MLKDENQGLKSNILPLKQDLIASYSSKKQISANTFKSILEETRSLLLKKEIHQT